VNEVGGYRCEPPAADPDADSESTSSEMDPDGLTDNTIPDSTGKT